MVYIHDMSQQACPRDLPYAQASPEVAMHPPSAPTQRHSLGHGRAPQNVHSGGAFMASTAEHKELPKAL